MVRVLIADMTTHTTLPAQTDKHPSDDELNRARTAETANRFAGGLMDTISELADLGLLTKAVCEVKTYPTTPAFKLYIINGTEVFFGFYPIWARDITLEARRCQSSTPWAKTPS